VTGDELLACEEFPAQNIQHPAKLCDQFKGGSGSSAGTELQFNTEDKLSIEFSDGALGVREKLDEFAGGVACLAFSNI